MLHRDQNTFLLPSLVYLSSSFNFQVVPAVLKLFVFSIVFGQIFCWIEGWSLLDGVYFILITGTTVSTWSTHRSSNRKIPRVPDLRLLACYFVQISALVLLKNRSSSNHPYSLIQLTWCPFLVYLLFTWVCCIVFIFVGNIRRWDTVTSPQSRPAAAGCALPFCPSLSCSCRRNSRSSPPPYWAKGKTPSSWVC